MTVGAPWNLPRRPKLVQSPLSPTLMLAYATPPFLMRSLKDMFGHIALRAFMACLHPAGISMLIRAFVCAGPDADATGALTLVPIPRNLVLGHVIIMSMHPSFTNQDMADTRLTVGGD
jgi:hypothetical protein